MNTKSWWQSKTIWTGILGVAFALYDAFRMAVQANFGTTFPEVPVWIFGILGAFGIVFRTVTTTRIS